MLGSTIMVETNMAESDYYPPAVRRDSLSDPFNEQSIHLRLSDTSEVTALSWGNSSLSSIAGSPSVKQNQGSWLCCKCSYTNTDSFRSTCAICGGPNDTVLAPPTPQQQQQQQQRRHHSPTTTDSNYMSFSGLSMLTQADSDGSSADIFLQRRTSDATIHSKSTARTGVSTLLISNCVQHKEEQQPQPARAASPISQDGSDCTQRTTNSTSINSVITITNRGRKAIPHDDPEEKPSHRIFRPVRNVSPTTAASVTVAGDSAEVSSTILTRQRPERRNSSRSLGAPSRQQVPSHRSIFQRHRHLPDEGMTPCMANPPTRTNSRRRPNNTMVAPCPPEFSHVRRPKRKPKKDDDEWSCSVGLEESAVDMFQPGVKT